MAELGLCYSEQRGKGTVRPKEDLCLGVILKNEGEFRHFSAGDEHFVKHQTAKH